MRVWYTDNVIFLVCGLLYMYLVMIVTVTVFITKVLISSKIVDLANFELDVLVFTSVAEVGPCRTFN